MKKIAQIKDFSIYYLYNYRVYYKDQYGDHLEYTFDSLKEALEYVTRWFAE